MVTVHELGQTVYSEFVKLSSPLERTTERLSWRYYWEERLRTDEETIGQYEILFSFAVFLALVMKYLKHPDMERQGARSNEIRFERCYDLVCYTSDVELRKLRP
jgi:hypothetical protein